MTTPNAGWRDLYGMTDDGGGAFDASQINDINKALTAGYDITNPGAQPGNGFPLRIESLEATLKVVTYKMEHLKFWKAIPKIPAYQTNEQHNVLRSYGQGEEGFVPEISLPNEEDSVYERQMAQVKFLGTTRRTSHVMSMIRTAHGDAVGNEQVNGTMWLLKVLERALFYGRSDLSGIQFDGFEKLIRDNAPAANIIDMRGQPLDEDILTDLSATVSDSPNFGRLTHLHMSPKIKQDLVKGFFARGRYDIKDGVSTIGNSIDAFNSDSGPVKLEANPFVNDGGPPPATAYGDALKRPGTPSISTAATSPVDALGQFAADESGSYVYRVSAHNDFGASASIDVGGAIVVTSGDRVQFGVLPNQAAPAPKWYQVYRSRRGGTETRMIARVPNSAGMGELIINDYNGTLPFTSSVFGWQQDLECLSWKQLAPMLKIPLATIDTSIRWMQLIYGVPVLYAPGRTVLVRNVGRAPNFKGQP